MVQTALDSLFNALHQLVKLVLPLGLLLAALLMALLLIGLLDRERSQRGLNWASHNLTLIGRWALAALGVGAGMLLLGISRQAVDTRLSTQQSARYANAADPDGGQTVQGAPRVTYLKNTTYTRSMTLPPDVYARIKVGDGWQNLLPYFATPEGTTVKDLQEGFKPQGSGASRTLVYSREVTLQTEETVNLDSSKVVTDLKFVDPAGGRGTYYNALFNADYTFSNPLEQPATMHFAFPLPSGSGTLSNFKLTVDGKEFRASDLVNGSIWEGEVPARGKVTVNVTYRNQGARSWSYQLGQRREAIKYFSLTINADRPAKFQRYTLFPTSQTHSALGGGGSLTWQLQDVITAQDIAVVFMQGSIRETLGKVGFMKPLSVLLAALLVLAWAWTRRQSVQPLPLAGAALGLALGFTLGGVLSGYLPVLLAEILGVIAGVALASFALSGRFLTPLALAAAVPLAFLTGGNAGLLLTLLAAVTLVLLLRPGLTSQRKLPVTN